jgi:hypothetical protein
MALLMAHGSGGVILFGRPKSMQKVADTHGFGLPSYPLTSMFEVGNV